MTLFGRQRREGVGPDRDGIGLGWGGVSPNCSIYRVFTSQVTQFSCMEHQTTMNDKFYTIKYDLS